jgi:hypothetical protein
MAAFEKHGTLADETEWQAIYEMGRSLLLTK